MVISFTWEGVREERRLRSQIWGMEGVNCLRDTEACVQPTVVCESEVHRRDLSWTCRWRTGGLAGVGRLAWAVQQEEAHSTEGGVGWQGSSGQRSQ